MFAKNLGELLNDPYSAKQIGMRAHASVLEKYANEKLAQKLVEMVTLPHPIERK